MMSIQTKKKKKTIGITDLKRSDTAFIDNLLEPIAVLKRDTVKAYLIPEKLMAYFMDKLDDLELVKTVNSRLKDLEAGKTQTIAVEINEL